MDFLKSAVVSAISKDPPFGFKFGDPIPLEQSIWSLHNGTKRDDGSECSLFSFDISANRSQLPFARNAVRSLRVLRHPGLIRIIDTVETDSNIYIATEHITPLIWQARRKSQSEETLKWGLSAIANTLAFINDEATMVHGLIRMSSIFISGSGEWRLGGMELLSSTKDEDAILHRSSEFVQFPDVYRPPEFSGPQINLTKRNNAKGADSYGYGILLFEVFNGVLIAAGQIGQTKSIPPSMHQNYRRLTVANPKSRLSLSAFRDQGSRLGGFFDTPLIKLSIGVESLALKDEVERDAFLDELDEAAEDFPEDYFRAKILPELLKCVEFSGGGRRAFSSIMKIAKRLPDEEWDASLTPAIVRLFANPDRAIRLSLLEHLPDIIDHLTPKLATSKVFPQMATGFTDLAPVVREQTVKSVLTIITKLSERTINGDLLKYMARTSNDEQPGIRTNTIICLGKIARHLNPTTRQKVLIAAFTRCLKDPFVHARIASLLALAATVDIFDEEESASKILPALCPVLVDKEVNVRDQTNRVVEAYLQKVLRFAAGLPKTAINDYAVGKSKQGLPEESTDSSKWTSWAISSFTNRLGSATDSYPTSGQLQSGLNKGTSKASPISSKDRDQTRPGLDPISVADRAYNPGVQRNQADLAVERYQSERAKDEDDDGFDEGWHGLSVHEPFEAASDTNVAKERPATVSSFDDGGEPDFEGWLNAQARAKPKSKNIFPKGNMKHPNSTSRPIVSKSQSVPTSSKESAFPRKAQGAGTKQIVTSPAEQEDDWGDAW